ncbi:MAG: tryptophan synthase subunit alpha [Epsilonproteobacteria bacterium]|nr:tryptophan synthase subunit alpha [Campylobacterota bacterium]
MKQLVAYLTTAYPDTQFTVDAILALKEAGVDKIELGIPFSDPVADGAVIQKANLLALQNGFRLKDVFDVSKAISGIDIYLMGYFNNFYHKGYEYMVSQAKQHHIKGFIIPDLPYEEAVAYADLFPLISFVAPTDSKQRIQTILQNAQEFIYLVAYAGITGSNKEEDLTEVISHIREASDTPLFIGFGVNAQTAKQKAKNVDGVIVGSAFIQILLSDDSYTTKIKKLQDLASSIKQSIN